MKQISVFLENKPGSLHTILKTMTEWGVNLRALALADTAEFGVLRFIVANPEGLLEKLKKGNFTATITEILVVAVADRPGGLSEVVELLTKNGFSIEYLYAFVTPLGNGAYVVLRVEEYPKAQELLRNHGILLLEDFEL
ncbi:MAG TPA: ACT domain-containing protein [Atribacteraceae bacterium]|nr:ACT domain-containing protein [Atribacteraceae bacterium]